MRELELKWHGRSAWMHVEVRGGRAARSPPSDGTELHQSPDRVLVERVLAGRVVEPGLDGVAVAHRAAAGEHAWRRGDFLWGEIMVVSHGLLKAVAEAVSVDWQQVSGLVAAEAGGGRRRRGLAEGKRGARTA